MMPLSPVPHDYALERLRGLSHATVKVGDRPQAVIAYKVDGHSDIGLVREATLSPLEPHMDTNITSYVRVEIAGRGPGDTIVLHEVAPECDVADLRMMRYVKTRAMWRISKSSVIFMDPASEAYAVANLCDLPGTRWRVKLVGDIFIVEGPLF